MKDLKGYLLIMAAATFWGCSATAAKFLLNQDVDTILIVQTRVGFSALLLFLFYLLFKPHLLSVKQSDLWRFALLGVLGVAGSNFTYYFTIKGSTVATAIILQYTAPIFVMGYAAVSKEEEITSLKAVASVVSLLGCFLAVGGYDAGALTLSPGTLISGIGSMVTFSFLIIYTRHILKLYSVWTVTFYAIAFASVFWLFVNPPWTMVEQSPPGSTWTGLFVLAIISVLIPHTLYFAGMQYIPPSRAAVTSTLEPVVAIVSAAVFLGELLQPGQVVGATIVLCAIGLLQMKKEGGADAA